MKVVQQKLPKNTAKLTITLTVEEVAKAHDKVWSEVVKNAELDGFRKGTAPAELVKQRVDPAKVEAEVINDLIKTYYPQAVDNQKIFPIIAPSIDLQDLTPDKEFTFTATFATRPQVVIGDYKKAVKDAYDKKNAKDKGGDESSAKAVNLTPNEIIEAVTSVTTVEVSDMVIEEEVNKMLSRLVNQIQAIKLDVDAYLKSQNKTSDSLKAEYTELAKKNITGELAMIEVVKLEGVEATDAEVDQTLNAMGDAKLKEQYSKDEYQKAYIKSIIAKNKVIWKLSGPEENADKADAPEEVAKKEASDDK